MTSPGIARSLWHTQDMHPETPILSLFSGIGGFELGFRKAGFSGAIHAYENWDAARSVLEHRLPYFVSGSTKELEKSRTRLLLPCSRRD